MGWRRRRRDRDEFFAMHAKIAAIHGDLLRRDEELLAVLSDLAVASQRIDERLAAESGLFDVINRVLETRDARAIDLTGTPRVLGGSIGTDDELHRAPLPHAHDTATH
jgi:hypothetical protein